MYITEKEDCISIIWIAYMEIRNAMKSLITTEIYWDFVCDNIENKLNTLRRERNRTIRMTSGLSFNQTYGESHNPVESFIPVRREQFENKLFLRYFIQGLGAQKYKLVKLIIEGENLKDIIEIMHINTEQYNMLLKNIRRDFIDYFY